MNKVLENQFYYLDNFQLVLAWITERYHDLLTEDEHAFIAQFSQLPQTSRALFVRMVMRKGSLFRASKLNYAEIGNTKETALPLLATGWIETDPCLDLEQLFELLLKHEISQAFQLTAAEKGLRKPEQLALLGERFAQEPDTRHFSHWYPDSGEQVYQVLNKDLCERLRLIFFGNFHQGWSEFVLSDLGIYQYEKVEFSLASRGFRSRQDIDDYLALQRCRERFYNEDPVAEVLQDLSASLTGEGNDWLAGRRDKFLFQIAEHLEKAKDWDGAVGIYSACRHPGARVRSIRVLEKNGQSALAHDLLKTAQDAPESEAELQQLLRIAPRLNRKLGHAKLAVTPSTPVQRIDLSLPFPDEPCYVEGVVRDHLTSVDAPVFYVENALINSLFGLLCWQAIFKPLPGAFFHPFHRGPADLHSADFQQRRAAEFAACLAQLDTDEYKLNIRRSFAEKQGIQSPFVFWNVLSEELLELALSCIPAAHLKRWFERILLDIKTNRNGLPDLIQFWPTRPPDQRYRMIEVKGPGDKLQDNQKRWIDYCATHQIPITVCYLEWSEDSA